jgi:hypothetical protein
MRPPQRLEQSRWGFTHLLQERDLEGDDQRMASAESVSLDSLTVRFCF